MDVYNRQYKRLDLNTLFRHIKNTSPQKNLITFNCPYLFEKLADEIETCCSDVSFSFLSKNLILNELDGFLLQILLRWSNFNNT